MLSVLVLLAASTMDIVCGWQPMPDGSASYECVVQVEPEVIHKLNRGDEIPLSVDIPDAVRPISRIRIVVGSAQLPQQTLITSYQPVTQALALEEEAAEKKSREGLVETQYRNDGSVGNRYPSQVETADVLPPSNPLPGAQNAFSRGLQDGGQAVQDAANQFAQNILPPDAGQRLNNAAQRTGQEIGTQIGHDLRRIADTGRDDIKQFFGDNSAPLGGASGGEGQVLPPTGQGRETEAILPSNSSMKTAGGNTNTRRVDQPLNQGDAGRWTTAPAGAAENSVTPNSQTQSVAGGREWPPVQQPENYQPANRENSFAGGSAPPYRGNGANVVPPQNQDRATQQNSFQGRNPQQGVSAPDGRVASVPSQQTADEGPMLPPFNPSAGLDRDDDITPTATNTFSNSSVPEIRRGMNLQDDPVAENSRTTPPTSPFGSGQQSSSQQNLNPPSNQTSLAGQEQANYQPPATAGGPNSVFPLLLSWVLLSGSGAGNFYLLWSYLDVRNKYRDLVFDASRKIRGRHSDLD